ncbi:hypothetical protein Y032_0201g1732 [Ancylostoma ceylanicum]|uniref:GT23 domain-containing protein n=1 Tax=Ancylostoma ceylanicum TaxID=53326 RepID=A0A016SN76_9BILA|nr:hypothetical protein Y032_0201g1732 [Ancylostoma ceylanicum]
MTATDDECVPLQVYVFVSSHHEGFPDFRPQQLAMAAMTIDTKENSKKRDKVWSKYGYDAGEYEVERRKLERGLWEMLVSMSSNDSTWTSKYRVHAANKLVALLATSTKLELIAEQKRSSLRSITDAIQKELNTSQHPGECSNAKFLGCSLPGTCGFGCQVHHLTYCLLVAFASNRVLFIRRGGWGYHREGWTGAFRFPNTCELPEEEVDWPMNEDESEGGGNSAVSGGGNTETPFSDQKFFYLKSITFSLYRCASILMVHE